MRPDRAGDPFKTVTSQSSVDGVGHAPLSSLCARIPELLSLEYRPDPFCWLPRCTRAASQTIIL